MTDHAFIPDHELKLLRRLLADIPSLAEDLAVTVVKQARLGDAGRSRKPRRPSEQPLPYHSDAAAVAEELHAELAGWVRHVCEHRGLTYGQTVGEPTTWLPLRWMPDEFVGPLQLGRPPLRPQPPPTSADLARWLRKRIYSLAMTPGAEDCYRTLRGIADSAERLLCPPARDVQVDAGKLEEARRMRLNASGIATLAPELGEEFRNLTRRRVFVLKEAGEITPVPGPWAPGWMLFEVGGVLDAHLRVPIRARHMKAS